MRILLSNDDGIHATGIYALYDRLKTKADVWMVAPVEEKSTTGHSLTLHKPLRINQIDKRIFSVNGSPADCVNMAIKEILPKKPDIVISGINRGANLGQDVYYSGTVSAAREACIMGFPAVAVSLAVDFGKNIPEEKLNYRPAAELTLQMLDKVKKTPFPKHTLLSLNVPDLPLEKIKGVKLARQGFRFYDGDIVRRKDHRGKPYYWVGGNYRGFIREEGTDCTWVDSGYASVVPVQLDTTDIIFLTKLSENWPTKWKGIKFKSPRAKKS